MNKKTNDFFNKICNSSKYKRLEILFSVLALVIVVSSVVFYQIGVTNRRNAEEQALIDQERSKQSNVHQLSPEQRAQALSVLKTKLSNSPPITKTERDKALEQLRKAINTK